MLELRDCRADLGNAPDDLMAGNARVDGGHDAAPLVANLVEIGVTDAAIQNFNLYVVFGWIAPCYRSGGQRRCRTGSGVSFGVMHALNLRCSPFIPICRIRHCACKTRRVGFDSLFLTFKSVRGLPSSFRIAIEPEELPLAEVAGYAERKL